MIIEVSQTFRDLNLSTQCVELATCFLGILVLTTNTLCIVQLTRQRGFCLLHTSSPCSHTLMSSLFGSNCLVGTTSLVKEILLIFVENDVNNDMIKAAKINDSRMSTTILAAWKHFEWYVVIFCLVSASLHIFWIVLIYLIKSLTMSSASYHHKTVNTSARVLDAVLITLIWVLSLSPAYLQTNDPVQYRQILIYVSLMLLTCCCVQLILYLLINCQYGHYKRYLRKKQKQHYKDSRSLSSSPDSIVVVTSSTENDHDENRRCSNLVALTSRRRSRLKHKHRVICVWLIGSYLVASGPYLIYYPVLSKVQQHQLHIYQPDIIDSIVFLFVLLKCFLDALIFIVWKGWEQDKLKVNFKLNDENDKQQKISKSQASTTTIIKTQSISSTPHHSANVSNKNYNSSANNSSDFNGSVASANNSNFRIDDVSLQHNHDQNGRDINCSGPSAAHINGSSRSQPIRHYHDRTERDFNDSPCVKINVRNNGLPSQPLRHYHKGYSGDFNDSCLSVSKGDGSSRPLPLRHYHHHNGDSRNDNNAGPPDNDTNQRIFVETVVIDGVQQNKLSSHRLPSRTSDV